MSSADDAPTVATKKMCCGMIEGQYNNQKNKPPPSAEEKAQHMFPDLWEKFIWFRPRYVATGLPVFINWVWWFIYMGVTGSWGLFTDRYFMSITMMFGSMIAGGTSEGGASVAFPVMTLAFGIKPAVARDFSLMIQSIGMTAAAFTIVYLDIVYEKRAIIWSNLGGAIGVIVGLVGIAPLLSPPITKMFFVSVWASFAASLFLLNRLRGRTVYLQIPEFDAHPWKLYTLLLTGFIGGVFTAIAGSGIDICTFATLTLLFRVSEKTATPTSVILMGCNTVVGCLTKMIVFGLEPAAVGYWLVCVPIVVIGAPMGAFLASFVHRLVYAGMVYITDTVQFIAAVIIVPQTPTTITLTVVILVLGGITFKLMTWKGEKIMEDIERRRAAATKGDVEMASKGGDKLFETTAADDADETRETAKVAPAEGEKAAEEA
eukprot:PLAT11992.1.p1 GENE.PLAT11992.1~~PLAT11992.1.p1  ORF type:complete len:448 (+),score=226.03 PLAT11992.1:53-1345(+)